MELKDFIKTAIVDIVNGVTEAQEEIKGKGACVNPQFNHGRYEGKSIWSSNVGKGISICDIKFKLAIEEGRESSGGVKGGINVSGVVNFGGKKESKGTEQNMSSIEFDIPIVLPVNNMDEKYYEAGQLFF